MIVGLIAPGEGEILFRGEPVKRDFVAHRRRLGYVPEDAQIYGHLTGAEYLEMVGQLRGIDDKTLARKVDGFLKLFSLHGDRYVQISSYSKGMRQKILIAAALLHNPDLLLLDEPFTGLDVNSALVLRDLIRELAAHGKTVLFSSHELDVVERVSSRVVILHKGHVVANHPIAELRCLMELPTLEEIFRRLAVEQDTSTITNELIGLIES